MAGRAGDGRELRGRRRAIVNEFAALMETQTAGQPRPWVTSGFLLSVSLVVSAALAAASIYLKAMFPACDNVASTYGTAGALVALLVWI